MSNRNQEGRPSGRPSQLIISLRRQRERATARRERRKPRKPRPANPASIIAQVEASGTRTANSNALPFVAAKLTLSNVVVEVNKVRNPGAPVLSVAGLKREVSSI